MQTNAKDIMTTELILANPDMTIEEAIQILVNNHITGMPVVDKDQRLVGVVSELDIMHSVQEDRQERPIDLKDKISFTRKVTTIKKMAPLQEILKLFLEKKVRRLPVVADDGKLVGIISRRDIMRVLYYRSKEI